MPRAAVCFASVANGTMNGSGIPSGSWSRTVAVEDVVERVRRPARRPAARRSRGRCRTRPPAPARSARRPSSRIASSVVPGSTRQSISTVASPGMTLYFTPAWMMFGLTVSRRRARIDAGRHRLAERVERGLRESGIVAGERAQDPGRLRRRGCRRRRGRTPPSSAVSRGGPWTASRADDLGGEHGGVVVARHRAVAPRPADGDPVDGIALLGDADRVEAAAAERRRDRAGLVDRAGRLEQLRSLLDEDRDAVQAARFLVRGRREQDVAGQARAPGRTPGRDRPRGPRPPAAAPRSAPSRRGPSCRRRRGPRRSRPRRRRRTDRGSSARAARARRRGGRGAGAARRPCRRRAAAPSPSRDPGRARGPPARGPASARAAAIQFAARSSPSGHPPAAG